MHTWTSRSNALAFYAFFGSCLLASYAAVSSLWLGGEPIIRECRIAKVEKFTSDSHAKKMNPLIRAPQGEIAALRTNIDTDFRPLFHWNVKQLFVFVIAEYQTGHNETSEVTIFDTIIRSPSEANIQLQSVGKYFIVDESEKLKGNLMKIHLKWDIMPATGILFSGKSDSVHSLRLPNEYCFDVQCQWEDSPQT
eukprot:gb/GECG01013016.1/.p1 GENE.gb/GECG01013016.1/~~gb/GECG01013016.1/.p1  ORF type:complete len:194 (+),score=18.78 gb/GECG01013016.1/:1-582(+)